MSNLNNYPYLSIQIKRKTGDRVPHRMIVSDRFLLEAFSLVGPKTDCALCL